MQPLPGACHVPVAAAPPPDVVASGDWQRRRRHWLWSSPAVSSALRRRVTLKPGPGELPRYRARDARHDEVAAHRLGQRISSRCPSQLEVLPGWGARSYLGDDDEDVRRSVITSRFVPYRSAVVPKQVGRYAHDRGGSFAAAGGRAAKAGTTAIVSRRRSRGSDAQCTRKRPKLRRKRPVCSKGRGGDG